MKNARLMLLFHLLWIITDLKFYPSEGSPLNDSPRSVATRNGRSNNRFHSIAYPGETYPTIVEASIGDDFNITCIMNPLAFPGRTVKDLYFVNGRTDQQLPSQNLYVLNETTVIYMVRHANEQQEEYRCKCGADAIMESRVYVGYPPRPVEDFICRSYDLEYMVCNFTKPFNPILTQYNVTFYTDSMEEYSYEPKCDFDGRTLVVCNTSLADNYRPRAELYHYVIQAQNSLAKMPPQHFTVKNWDVMTPAPPGIDYLIETLTDSRLVLRWRMPKWEEYRMRGLQWQTIIKVQNETDIKRPLVPERDHGTLRLSCDDLPYANWNYVLELRVRVRTSNNSWSDTFRLPFKTGERIPDRPPLVADGGFYIDSMETKVTVYWQQLSHYEYNGKKFNYSISATTTDNGKTISLKPLQHHLNLAIFPWNKYSRYEFVIRSANRLGVSVNGSRIVIPSFQDHNIKEFTPKAIHNVYHAGNRTYRLSWSHPVNTTNLLNYTVYWCFPKRALPNECKGPMHFLQLPHNQLSYTTVSQNALQEHTLNLAVSADYLDFNSGLHWTDCTMDLNSDLIKMDPEVVAHSAHSLIVQWSVDRICTSILKGFRLIYCEVDRTNSTPFLSSSSFSPSPSSTHSSNNPLEEQFKVSLHSKFPRESCTKDSIRYLELSKHLKKYEITELKAFTVYSVSMLMYSELKKGQISDPQIVRTLEAAPMPPRQLQVTEITNNSASISWLPPTQSNGIIRQYVITLNNDRINVNADTLQYRFTQLESFVSYKVYVAAQGIELSPPSNDVHFTTLIGVPSPPGSAVGDSSNNNLIQWSKPFPPRGRIDYYEVAIIQMRYDEVLRRRISLIHDGVTSCSFRPPPCIGPEYKTIVEVRAVNIAPNVDVDFLQLLPTTTIAVNIHDVIRNPSEEEEENSAIYQDNEDLVCVPTKQQSAWMKENTTSVSTALYRLYKSPWRSTKTYACSTSRMSRITLVALTIVALLIGILSVLYLAGKKYNKMANINCTLPAGLDSYFNKDTVGNVFLAAASSTMNEKIHTTTTAAAAAAATVAAAAATRTRSRSNERILSGFSGTEEDGMGSVGGGGGGGINQWFKVNRLHETYNFRNECDHLLDSIGHDSGYGRLNEDSQRNPSSERLQIVDEQTKTEATEDGETTTIQLNDDRQQELEDNDHGYCGGFQRSQRQEQVREQQSSPTSGYITVDNLNFLSFPSADVEQRRRGGSGEMEMDDEEEEEESGGVGAVEGKAQIKAGGYVPIDALEDQFMMTTITGVDSKSSSMKGEGVQRGGGGGGGQGVCEHNALSEQFTGEEQQGQQRYLNCGGNDGNSAKEKSISGYVTQYDLNVFAARQQRRQDQQ